MEIGMTILISLLVVLLIIYLLIFILIFIPELIEDVKDYRALGKMSKELDMIKKDFDKEMDKLEKDGATEEETKELVRKYSKIVDELDEPWEI